PPAISCQEQSVSELSDRFHAKELIRVFPEVSKGRTGRDLLQDKRLKA
ncbi:uncharacterized, partial [Tachysurus ichikawai]